MGEVYRARDTRLNRDVAVKVLPQHLSAQPEVRARFEREAKTVSSLNHPNICTLFDVGVEGDTDYLVMELVEGETLAERLTKGPVPVDEVLRLGSQIAEALGRAHRAGVVHRDLKPGNVMLTRSGAKLMDFGLARVSGLAAAPGGGASESGVTVAAAPRSPMMSQPLTAEGTIVGTFQYMAPEQLEGREADARSDVWALGCVLYEMTTGRRAFEGASQASLISSIMREEPRPLFEIMPLAPQALDRLVRECLAKDPELRVQNAHDVKLQLDWIRSAGSQASVAAPVLTKHRSRERVLWAVALTVVTLGAIAAVLFSRGAGSAGFAVHAAIPAPPGALFSSSYDTPIPLALSADGTQMAFCARSGEGPDMLWVRALDSAEAKALAGTEGATSPFFSADGRSLGFFAHGKLLRVDIAGGPVVPLADAADPRGGTWSRDGVILFAPSGTTSIARVSAEGGKVTAVTALDKALGESTHRYPQFLPDGRHFLYLARRAGAGAGNEPTIYAAELGAKRPKRVLGVASNVRFASGYLLYVQDGVLLAQPFDAGRLTTTGAPVTVAADVRWENRFSRGVFAVSNNGVLAYMTGRSQTRTQLLWMDRTGRPLERVGESMDYTYGGTPEISPDGKSAAMAVLNPERGTSTVFVVDLATGRSSRLTVDETDHPSCAWTQDGRGVVVSTPGHGKSTLVLCRMGGTQADTLIRAEELMWPTSVSPDGRFVLYYRQKGADDSDMDLFAAAIGSGGTGVTLAATSASEYAGKLSWDGRYAAYVSDESGKPEVYVVTFPERTGKWQVSQGGGKEPRWSRDGRELFYIDEGNNLQSVEVVPSPQGFQAGAVRKLFQFHGAGGLWRYDISADGSKFLVTVPPSEEAPPPVTLVTRWTAKLGK